MKRQQKKQIDNLLSTEEPYWLLGGILSSLIVGFIDGGVTTTILYSVNKFYKKVNHG